MKNFNDRGGNRGGFRDRGPVTMHPAVCAECGNSCQVPFRPSGDKPVYCSNCFGGKREGGKPNFAKPSFERSRENHDNRGSGNEDIKRQLEAISGKLDQLIRSIDRLAESNKPVSKKTSKTKSK